MATIKSISLTDHRATLTFNEGSSLTIHLEAYVKATLREGQTLDSQAIETLKQSSAFFEALEQSYRWLSFKAYTVKALRQRLSETFEAFVVAQVITQLIQENYLNDERYLQDRLDEALQFDLKGPKHYQNAWFTLGFPKPLIESALASVSDERWQERCLKVMQKTIDQAKALPLSALKDKASLKAQRLGYAFAHIEAVQAQLVYPTIDTHALLEHTLTQLKVNPKTLTPSEKQKLIQKLMRRGFPYDAIQNVIRQR